MKKNQMIGLTIVLGAVFCSLLFYRHSQLKTSELQEDTSSETIVEFMAPPVNKPVFTVIPPRVDWKKNIIPVLPQFSVETLKKFREKTKLDLPVPSGLEFHPIDFDEEVAGIYGTTLSGDKEFVALATRGEVSLEQAVAFVEESRKAFPFLEGAKIDTSKVLELEPSKGSGLKKLQIIPTTKKGKSRVFIAFTQREDEQGTYMFMMQAPTKYYDENEDGLELLLQQLKARP